MKGTTRNEGDAAAVARAVRMFHELGFVPDYEQILEGVYRRFLAAGDYVADVGAFVGRHLDHFVDLVGPGGRVVAFEPIPDRAATLSEKFAGYANVQVRACALGREVGSAPFTYLANMPWYSGLKKRYVPEPGAQAENITVALDTLDNTVLALPRLDFIKIDIEGGEIDCLKGGEKTLAKHRPLISAEYGHSGYARYGYDGRSLFDFATARGYTLGDFFGNMIATPAQWERTRDISYWDYFLVPIEKVEWWQGFFPEPAQRLTPLTDG